MSSEEFIDKSAISAVKDDPKLYSTLKTYPSEQKIQGNTAFYYVNKLNKETIELHSKGKKGWKTDFKNLKEYENSGHRMKIIDVIDAKKTQRQTIINDYLPKEIHSKTPNKESDKPTENSHDLLKSRRQALGRICSFDLDLKNIGLNKAKNYGLDLDLKKKLDDADRLRPTSSIKILNKDMDSLNKGLDCFENTDKIKMHRAVTSMKKFSGGNLRKRIRSVQRDKSVSPLSKIKKIRYEFEAFNKSAPRVRRPMSTSEYQKHGDAYLISLR